MTDNEKLIEEARGRAGRDMGLSDQLLRELADALEASVKEVDTSPEPVKNGADSLLIEEARVAYVEAWEAARGAPGASMAPHGTKSRAGIRAAFAVFEKAHAPTDEFRFTDDEWRAYQAIPDQGYSHRHSIENIVNSRRPAPEEPEWEYRCTGPDGKTPRVFSREAVAMRHMKSGCGEVQRRKAGPWVPVKQEGGE